MATIKMIFVKINLNGINPPGTFYNFVNGPGVKKVGNTNSIYVVKYSMLHNFVSLAVISLIAFSHRIFQHKIIVT